MAETERPTRQMRRNLTYPLNLKTEGQKSYIRFETLLEESLTINGLLTNLNNTLKSGLLEQALETAIEVDGASTTSGEAFQVIKEKTAELNVSNISGNITYENKAPEPSGLSAELYMPIAIVFPDGANYENYDIGFLGAAGERALKSGNLGGAVSDAISSGVNTFSQGLSGAAGSDIATLASVQLLKAIPGVGGQFNTNAQLASRVTTNPNARVLFKGVNFREFTFQFKFIASSEKESREIKSIVDFFREEMYPESIEQAGVAVGYKYPDRFKIDMMYNGTQIFNKLKPCYLRAVTTSFNSTQQSFHSDGTPTEIDLTLTFQESRTLNKQDIKDGF
mgnify:CR=1 FL=1